MIVNIILGLLIIHTLSILIFKPKLDTLTCGIFGWAGKDPKKFNRNKLNMLGIQNETRGVHSCGISKDGEISIGIDEQKLFRNFLANSSYDNPKLYPIVLGHTRQSTYGAHTIANAHPFGYGTGIGGGYKTIGVHNGTLLNHTELAKQYDIDLEAPNGESASGYQLTRTKIDSEIILEIISKTKNYKVLSEYTGAAALVWTDTDKPNVMYCFHGESRKRDWKDSELEIERPLYFYQESKNSVYISSIFTSLLGIGATTKNSWSFTTNVIYEITDGDVKNAKRTKISRATGFQTGPAMAKSNVHRDYAKHSNKWNMDDYNPNDDNDASTCQLPIETWQMRKNKKDKRDAEVNNAHNAATNTNLLQIQINNNIYTETPAEKLNFYGNRIYMNMLRYWRNGHKINGIFTFVEGFGFYFLGFDEKEAKRKFKTITNQLFLKYEFSNIEDIQFKDRDAAFYPFIDNDEHPITIMPFHYFHDGIRLRSKSDYIVCASMDERNLQELTAEQLSYCAAHPIVDLTSMFKNHANQEIMYEGNLVTDTFCPLGSEKVYVVEIGNCVSRSVIRDNRLNCEKDTKKIIESDGVDQTKLNLIVGNLEELENDIMKKETKVIALDTSNEDELDDDINDMFKDALQKFPAYMKRLEKYKSSRANIASAILNKLIKDATVLIAIELKE